MSLFSTHPPLEERIARLRGGRFEGPHGTEEASQPADRQAQARAMWDKLSDKP
jgi:heat shock protein HtpX